MFLFQNIVQSKTYYQPFWITLIIVLSVLIIGYLYYAYRSRLAVITEAIFTTRLSAQLSREEHLLSNPVSLLLSVNFLITVSLFLLQIFSSANFSIDGFQFDLKWFFVILSILFSVYLIKIITVKIFAFIFHKEQIGNEYIFSVFTFNQLVGIFFIPLVILNAYSQIISVHILMYTGIGILALAFLIRIGKGAVAAFASGQVTLFYLFLYFCTLEVMPLLLAWKLLHNRG